MNPESRDALSRALLPTRLNGEQAAILLGLAAHAIPTLVAVRLLRPLRPAGHTAVKYFATVELLRLREDPTWFAKATEAMSGHDVHKRSRRGLGRPKGASTGCRKRTGASPGSPRSTREIA